MENKVLIAFPTSEAKDYCLKEFAEQLRNITYAADILIIDNSKNEHYLNKIKNTIEPINKSIKYIRHYRDIKLNRLIAECHNIIIDNILEGKYDYWFSLESDIFIPCSILEHLLFLRKIIVGVPYFLGQHFLSRYICHSVEDFGQIVKEMPMSSNEGFVFTDGTIKDCNQLGLGCLLVHCSVLKQIRFRIPENAIKSQFDDTFFHKDVQKLGIPVYCDTNIIAYHQNKNWNKLKYK